MPHRRAQLLLPLVLITGGAAAAPASAATGRFAAFSTSIWLLDAILLFLVANIAALLLFSIATRIWRDAGQRRRERFRARWEPLLYGRMSDAAAPLPPLAPGERLMFLILWLHMLGYVRDEAAEALAQAGRDLGLSAYVLRLLDAYSGWRRVVAIRATGPLRLAQAREALVLIIAQNRPKYSLSAARALMQIDPRRGFAGLQQLLRHLEWSPGAMVEIVKAGGTQALQLLAGLVLSAPPGRAREIVRLIELTKDSSALPALRERLCSNRDEEEVAAIVHALGRLGGAQDRLAVLTFLTHANWLLRMRSAAALGSLGRGEDCDRIVPLLRDRNWWVRYRAAQTLLRLNGAEALGALRDGESDAYARDMLERVLAEGE